MENRCPTRSVKPFPLSQLPLEVLAKIVLNLDSVSIGNLVKACPSLSGHFIFLSDGGVDSPGKGLDWLPAHNLDEFLKSHCRGPRVRLSIPGYIRLIFVYDLQRIKLIFNKRAPETPEEDLFMTLVNERSIVHVHQRTYCKSGYCLGVYNLRKRNVTVRESSATLLEPPYSNARLEKTVCMFRERTYKFHLRTYLHEVRLRFESSQTEKHRRLENILLPNLQCFVIEYTDVLPIFINSSIGESVNLPWRENMSPVLIITHLGAEDPYRITPLSPVETTPESIKQSGFNDFIKNFLDVRINGGPNSLLHELDFSETKYLCIKQASLQGSHEPPLPHEIYAPRLKGYVFESIFPSCKVPRIVQEERLTFLGSISIIAHRSGLSFNQALHSWPRLSEVALINYKDGPSEGRDTSSRKRARDLPSPNTVNMSDLPTLTQLGQLECLNIHGFLFNGDLQLLERARSTNSKFVLDFAEPERVPEDVVGSPDRAIKRIKS